MAPAISPKVTASLRIFSLKQKTNQIPSATIVKIKYFLFHIGHLTF